MKKSSSNWSDLFARALSAVVMACVAIIAVLSGGFIYLLLISVVIGLGMWEFARLQQAEPKSNAYLLGGLAGLSFIAFGLMDHPLSFMILGFVPLLGTVLVGSQRALFFAYSSVIMMAGLGFIWLENTPSLIWFVLIIITSDVAGYFAGRFLGGPKFWPKISPKKTWSGTIAGWIGAFVLGIIASQMGHNSLIESVLFVVIAFAGQMGDIAQSAIKRRAGVKDSSQLIPGHGGVLDRFDAMISASAVLVALFAVSYVVSGA